MDLSRKQTKQFQGLAILLMLGLHLFNRGDIEQVYTLSGISVFGKPLLLYISYIFDACVPIYLFCSGYGQTAKAKKQGCKFKIRLLGLKPLIIKYWCIVLITCLIGHELGMKEYPGGVWKLVSNLLLLQNSYVGAFWFVQTYVLLTILFGFLYTLMTKHRRRTILIISLLVYVLAFAVEYVLLPTSINYHFLNLFTYSLVLLFRSQLSYVIGIGTAIRPVKILDSWRSVLRDSVFWRFAIILLLIVARGIFAHLIVAPFSALVLIFVLSCQGETTIAGKILLFFSRHSTNIWMVHMQYYMIFASTYIFWSSNPVITYATLLIVSLITSYLINAGEKTVKQVKNKLTN